MPNSLGELIADEVGRAEADMLAVRNRGQAVLAASGALVTLLAGLLAIAFGRDSHLSLSWLTVGTTVTALLAFVAATVFVLIMYLPSSVDATSSSDLANFAQNSWDEEGWDQQAAVVLTTYLLSMRKANGRLTKLLKGAVIAEVLGIASAAVMALSFVSREM